MGGWAAVLPTIWHPRGTGSSEERHMDEDDKENISKTAGIGAGMLGGAKVGQVVLPIPVVGSFAGAVLGGVVGSEVGKRVGKALINGATAFVDTLRDEGSARPAPLSAPSAEEDVPASPS